MKVAFVSEIPTPYRIPVFKLLSQESGLQSQFFFCSSMQHDRNWPIDDYHSLNKVVMRGWQLAHKGKNTSVTFINFEVISLIARGGFDLVVIAGWGQPTMMLAILTCLIKGIPYIIHTESHALKSRSWLKKAVRYFFPGIFVRLARGFLATGVRSQAYLKELGASYQPIVIFPNTIDVVRQKKEAERLNNKKSFLREELQMPGQYNLLFVGRLVHVKGAQDLLHAYSKIAAEINDWGLTIIGDGPLRNTLVGQIHHSHLAERVKFIAYIDPKELIRYYVASDLFVLPSLDEPWAVVVNEAMAAGMPLILSDKVGAAADLLVEGENGLSHSAGNVDELADRMLKLCQDENLRLKMGNRSKEIISSWGYEKNLLAFRELLARLKPVR